VVIAGIRRVGVERKLGLRAILSRAYVADIIVDDAREHESWAHPAIYRLEWSIFGETTPQHQFFKHEQE
jgi:hypothetical protein